VSHSVTQNIQDVAPADQSSGERCACRNLPPIFTKFAILVVSQEMWSPIVFGGNLEYWCLSNGKWN